MNNQRLRRELPKSVQYPRVQYPLPSNCWLCGRFGCGSKDSPKRWCHGCGVTWYAILPGVNPYAPVDRVYELRKIRARYLPRGVEGTGTDIFDNFIDHAEVKLPCPA